MKTFTLENSFLKITLSDFGAAWLSCVVKHPKGEREVLVTTSAENWQNQTAYFGATCGRYANRIANAEYQLNGKTYTLVKNDGKNTLHGGANGADKQIWQAEQLDPQAVKFSRIFADGEQGFGGEVYAVVTYRLNGKEVEIAFEATANQDTPLCFTNHAYFNLLGAGDVLSHQLMINADEYLPVGADGIPILPFKAVAHTGFDFSTPKPIGQDLLKDTDQQLVKGYDHAFKLVKNPTKPTACLTVEDLALKLNTSMPALQCYSGNWLGGQPNLSGSTYQDYAGVALEPEFFPDSPNQAELAKFGGITKAGERYKHDIRYTFHF
ncbi:galactose-1-epimerase [Actinobacillus pleuropneumoniae]|uniref:galactose-1-epimerase n=1 Tax=Actinobacillus pleuropneumoniae TaxID=715 RepID=UPI002020DD56|nr:galactose-1-epimerase [Actinobacillus pleuropneumoniae]MCL7724582.1 galactose-1-epimerase [Actinobacillus pleuropneumoniae]MCL7737987.1 galactose-1-epimerase [Actinobacillus pleuropneumoniae]